MKVLRIFIYTSTLLFIVQCTKDIIVQDIKNKTLIINAPANNSVTTSNQVSFWWEVLEGAEKYNLQIVKPSFASVTKLYLDTMLINNKFSIILEAGTYQWRIKAINGGGSTVFQTFNIKVDTTSNLSTQLVSTIAPSNNFLTGNKTINFSWNALNAATNYQIVILSSNNGVVKDTTTSLTNYTFQFPTNTANYAWKIRGLNNFSISQYNTPLTFSIDLTAPAASTPTLPVNGAIITLTNSIGWNRLGSPDAKYDSVFVATDSAFTNVVSRTKTYATSIPINGLNNAPPATSLYYWWRLRSVDSVGNRSVFSNQLKFKLVP
jgi:predicted phage tail protein